MVEQSFSYFIDPVLINTIYFYVLNTMPSPAKTFQHNDFQNKTFLFGYKITLPLKHKFLGSGMEIKTEKVKSLFFLTVPVLG